MKLSEYLALCRDSAEITVWDKEYDMETYFYGGPIEDGYDKAMSLIAQSADVVEISKRGVTVNFWDMIEKSRQPLINSGFYPEGSSTGYIMNDVAPILAGNISEEAMLEWAQIIYRSAMESDKAALYDKLLAKIKYARQSAKDGFGLHLLYEALGRVRMAKELGAISTDEFLELDHECVYKGINNPECFKR